MDKSDLLNAPTSIEFWQDYKAFTPLDTAAKQCNCSPYVAQLNRHMSNALEFLDPDETLSLKELGSKL
jgi:hypothetical protein